MELDYCRESDDAIEEISSLPEVCRFGVNRIREFLEPIVKLGLQSVLLFGVTNKSKKVNFRDGTRIKKGFCLFCN